MRTILTLCFALLSTTACTEKIFLPAPQVVQEEKMEYKSVGIGEEFTTFLILSVTDPNEQSPSVTYESPTGITGDNGKYVTKQFFGGAFHYVVQINFVAKATGTETVKITVSNQPNKVWTMMVIAGPSQKG